MPASMKIHGGRPMRRPPCVTSVAPPGAYKVIRHMSISDRDFASLRTSLEELIVDFRRHAERFPDLRHCMVESTSVEDPENPGRMHASSTLDVRALTHHFDNPGPPHGRHYYFDALPDHDGEGIEGFRRIACRAARIIEGWPEDRPGLPDTLCYPIRPSDGLEAESWMIIVHRLAWYCHAGQPLHATVTVPHHYDSQQNCRLPAGHPVSRRGKEPRFEGSIPGDCILSRLPDDSLGLACVWAIQLICHRIDNPELDIRFQEGWLPGVIRLIDAILQRSRELSESARSRHFVRKIPELEIRYLIEGQLPGQLDRLRDSDEAQNLLRFIWQLEKLVETIIQEKRSSARDGYSLTGDEFREFAQIRRDLAGSPSPASDGYSPESEENPSRDASGIIGPEAAEEPTEPHSRSGGELVPPEPTILPHVDQVRDIHDNILALINKRNVTYARDQEEEFLPIFTRLADLIREVRPSLDSDVNWPHPILRGLTHAIEQFDFLTEEWSWSELAKPEAERTAFIKSRLDIFRELVERPFYEAVLSWRAGWKEVKFNPFYDRYAEEAQGLGFKATLSPVEGFSNTKPEGDRRNHTPRLGSVTPQLSDDRRAGFAQAVKLLGAALEGVKPRKVEVPIASTDLPQTDTNGDQRRSDPIKLFHPSPQGPDLLPETARSPATQEGASRPEVGTPKNGGEQEPRDTPEEIWIPAIEAVGLSCATD
jgi:hypothetical protein